MTDFKLMLLILGNCLLCLIYTTMISYKNNISKTSKGSGCQHLYTSFVTLLYLNVKLRVFPARIMFRCLLKCRRCNIYYIISTQYAYGLIHVCAEQAGRMPLWTYSVQEVLDWLSRLGLVISRIWFEIWPLTLFLLL